MASATVEFDAPSERAMAQRDPSGRRPQGGRSLWSFAWTFSCWASTSLSSRRRRREVWCPVHASSWVSDPPCPIPLEGPEMSGFTSSWCPASSVTVSGMERYGVRLAVEWVSGIDRNTQPVGSGERTFALRLQRYHALNAARILGVSLEELQGRAPGRVVTASCLAALEEYLRQRQRARSRVEGQLTWVS